MAAAQEDVASKLPAKDWFTSLAATYSRQTGDSTADILASLIPDIQSSPVPISSSSRVHDIAAGPGTVTSLLFRQTPSIQPQYVLVSDNNPAMVAGAKQVLSGDSSSSSSSIEFKEIDAQDLSSLPDGSFTHAIMNFSIFLLAKHTEAMQDLRRTLKPNGEGLAVITTWKRFAAVEIIHHAQSLIKPDGPRMPLPGLAFYEEGYVASVMASAGFDPAKTQVKLRELIVKPDTEQYINLRNFMLSDFTKRAREAYSEEEEKRWPEVIDQALKVEVADHGGIKFEAWGVFAQT
jgi:ubiquinone/menaquinone biosynthesis C-methylase UbiE